MEERRKKRRYEKDEVKSEGERYEIRKGKK